jgi:uncharacterized protein (DUF427 family)
MVGGVFVADSTNPVLVWESAPYPQYYFPLADVRTDVLVPSTTQKHSPALGTAEFYTVKAGGIERTDAAWRYSESPAEQLCDLVAFDWASMDAWFEEDEEVYTHPRDPHSRVDILATSRAVRVEVDGVVLAESNHAHVLFETGLPPRWYLPKVDVHMDLLVPTDSATHCPYKGEAHYWSARVGDRTIKDLAWSYRTPIAESQKITGMIAFYNERVDLFIDGQLQQRPKTHFS